MIYLLEGLWHATVVLFLIVWKPLLFIGLSALALRLLGKIVRGCKKKK